MDTIPKVTDINGGMQDSSDRSIERGKKKERTKSEAVKSFGDIYDVRIKSAEFNRNSADFSGFLGIQEANKSLNKVVASLDNFNAEKLVESMSSEEIISLSKLIKKY